MENKKQYTLKELEQNIDLDEFTNDWCSDDGLDLDILCEKYNGSRRNIQRYAGNHKLIRSNIYINNKRKQTMLKKYGIVSPFANKEVQEKIKQTNLEKYGVKSPLQNKEIREKMKQTNLKKYGHICSLQNKEIQEKRKQTNLEKYGVENSCQADFCKNASNGMHSKPNDDFAKILDDNNIDYTREFPLKSKSYDFKIGNILIEINPSGTHNSTWGIHNKSGIEKDYHKNKSILANENGYSCIHVFDWDDKNKIINMLKPKTKIYARNCKIKELHDGDEYQKFINSNHLQCYCKDNIAIFGLYYNDKLVETISFGKPRYNKHYKYELLRLCIDSRYIIIGGTEKLFKSFIETYDPESIISYCDNSKFSGNAYQKLGFILKSSGNSSKHWYNIKTGQHITDNLLRQRGFDQLFDADYGKGTSNDQLMIEHGFVEIYDCGQSTYIWERE